jgi:hypothetical protein
VVTTYGYDGLSRRLRSKVYANVTPAGRVLAFAHDEAGRVKAITGQKPGGPLVAYASQASDAAHGGLYEMQFGNGLWDGVRPWVIANEGNIWFTRARDGSAVYAMVDHRAGWKYGAWLDNRVSARRASQDHLGAGRRRAQGPWDACPAHLQQPEMAASDRPEAHQCRAGPYPALRGHQRRPVRRRR